MKVALGMPERFRLSEEESQWVTQPEAPGPGSIGRRETRGGGADVWVTSEIP